MKILKIIATLLLSVSLFAYIVLEKYGKKLEPSLYEYLTIEATSITNNIVDSTVNDILAQNDINNLFIITEDKNKTISYFDYNTKYVNLLLSDVNKSIKNKIKNLEVSEINNLKIIDSLKPNSSSSQNGDLICTVSLRSINSNPLTSNLGPKIPIKMSFTSQVNSSLKTKAVDYGLNNVIFEVYLHVEIGLQIMMPLTSKKSTSIVDAPLTIKIIQGQIPNYVKTSLEKNSNLISLPIED